MVAGGQRHSLGQASCTGVIHAHQALEFGEFTDHGRAQIGFGKAGGLFGEVGVGTDQGGDFARKGGDAGDAVGLAAKFVVEGDGVQAIKPFGHAGAGHAQIVFPEEFRIGQPC